LRKRWEFKRELRKGSEADIAPVKNGRRIRTTHESAKLVYKSGKKGDRERNIFQQKKLRLYLVRDNADRTYHRVQDEFTKTGATTTQTV